MFCNGCNNNSVLWIIIILIILFGWGGCGCGNSCGCGCNNNNGRAAELYAITGGSERSPFFDAVRLKYVSDQLVYLVILFLDLTFDTVFHKRNARPAVVIRGHIRRVQTAPQVLNVLLMDVGRSVRLILTVLHARERGLDIYVKIYDEVECGRPIFTYSRS